MASSIPVTIHPAVMKSTPMDTSNAVIMYGDRLTPRYPAMAMAKVAEALGSRNGMRPALGAWDMGGLSRIRTLMRWKRRAGNAPTGAALT